MTEIYQKVLKTDVIVLPLYLAKASELRICFCTQFINLFNSYMLLSQKTSTGYPWALTGSKENILPT